MTDAAQTQEHVQKEFGFIAGEFTADEVIEYLNNGVKPLVEVVFTTNKVSMITLRVVHKGGVVKIRMHEEFLKAPFVVIESLRKYISTGRKSYWREVSSYAAVIPTQNRVPKRTQKLNTTGEVYDLEKILNEVKAEFFSSRISCRICWGRQRKVSRRRRKSISIRFGSWDVVSRLIRIHPILDSEKVPPEFIRYIVFHELLHAVVPCTSKNNRRYDHSPEYKKIERSFPGYKDMKIISKKLLDILL